jgi:lipoprotein NlpI
MFTRLVLSAVALVFVAGTASAAAYDDFATGVGAYEKNDDAQAITSLTAALTAPDLASGLKATAYLDRGRAYLRTHQCTLALADLNAAHALNTTSIEIVLSIADAQSCSGDFKSEEATLTTAMTSDSNPTLYYFRGSVRFGLGDFKGAADDFTALNKVWPRQGYPVLLLAAAQARAGVLDLPALKDKASLIDTGKWPAPVIQFYQGTATRDDINAAIAKSDPKMTVNQQCDADFFVGEDQVSKNDIADAKLLFQSAVDKCPDNSFAKNIAKIEIARLK